MDVVGPNGQSARFAFSRDVGAWCSGAAASSRDRWPQGNVDAQRRDADPCNNTGGRL